MNKIGKAMMYMMGGAVIAGSSYYIGLPKNKKQELKNKMSDMIKEEKDMLDDMM